ncbi:hypothetical protein [Aestuariivivens sp. NBU2969]|uniref:hypothetical protein n=1 Tax=Aestuariivivens sp. NBU2969 TaxID=2873267 RepID=UPI001CBB7D6E|nr:hypothetical protein [Aestuariivivens sp. NBU2969]
MERQFSIKRAFLDLLFIKIQLEKIFKGNQKYKELIDFMMSNDFLESDEPIPSLKQIGIDLDLKPYTLRKLIQDLYNEVFDIEKENFLVFNKTEIYFDLNYFENDRGYFKCNNLPYLPRVGENIDIPFLHAQVGTNYFYVDHIRHSFEADIQRIFISLKSGMYNKYFHYEKYKAFEERRISSHDLFYKNDVTIKRKLGLK